jgi:hypothetical protein
MLPTAFSHDDIPSISIQPQGDMMTQAPGHPGEDGEGDDLWSETAATDEAEPDDPEPDGTIIEPDEPEPDEIIAEPDEPDDADASVEKDAAPDEIPPGVPASVTTEEPFPTISPDRHPAIHGHALCLVARVVYGAAGTEPAVYCSASVDHQLPQSATPVLMAQLGELPPELVAVGHAALVRFAEKQAARAASPTPARAKPITPAKPTPPPVASLPPTGPRPTNIAPLTPATVREVEQLDLFAVAAQTATTPTPTTKEVDSDGTSND